MQTSRWQSSQALNLKTLGILSRRRVSKTKWTWSCSQPDRCLCSLLLGTDRYLPGRYSWSTTRNQSEKNFIGALIFMVLTWRPPTEKLLLLWTLCLCCFPTTCIQLVNALYSVKYRIELNWCHFLASEIATSPRLLAFWAIFRDVLIFLNGLYLILEWINRCEYTCQYIKGTVPAFCSRSCTLHGKVKNRSASLRTQGNSLPHCSYRPGYKVKKAGAGPASCTEEYTVFPE